MAVFFFLWFLLALREFLRRVDADGLLTTLAMVGGSVYAALTLTGARLQAGILTMSDDTYRDQVYPALVHAARDAGYVLHTSGGPPLLRHHRRFTLRSGGQDSSQAGPRWWE